MNRRTFSLDKTRAGRTVTARGAPAGRDSADTFQNAPSRGPGFWFVTVNRSRSDGLSGLTGTVVRRRAKGEVQEGTMARLRATKQRLERPQPERVRVP